MERTDGCHTARKKWREYRPPELPHYSVDGYCAETRTIYEFLGCYHHGYKCQPSRDVKTLANGETLAERYEQTMARIEQLVLAILSKYSGNATSKEPTICRHPIVGRAPLNTRDALYGGRTEAMRLHYKIKEVEETSSAI